MDVLTMGTLLGTATSPSILPSGYHTGGVTRKDYFPSLPFALDREVVSFVHFNTATADERLQTNLQPLLNGVDMVLNSHVDEFVLSLGLDHS